MASDDERRKSLPEQPESSLSDEQVVVSTEAVSEQGAGCDGENPSDGFGGSENTSNSCSCVKIGVDAALAGMSYDFGQSTMMRARVTVLESFARYFSNGFTRPPGVESDQDPQENEVVLFEDFFATPHLILLDILRKFQVRLH
jgi:hypothetical protein